MLNLSRLIGHQLETYPFQWAMVDGVFSPSDAKGISESYPTDHFKVVTGYDGEKGYEYHARSLIHMNAREATHADRLSPAWRQYATDLLSAEYRAAMSQLIGINIMNAPMEANIFHYGPGAWLGPHLDLKDK